MNWLLHEKLNRLFFKWLQLLVELLRCYARGLKVVFDLMIHRRHELILWTGWNHAELGHLSAGIPLRIVLCPWADHRYNALIVGWTWWSLSPLLLELFLALLQLLIQFGKKCILLPDKLILLGFLILLNIKWGETLQNNIVFQQELISLRNWLLIPLDRILVEVLWGTHLDLLFSREFWFEILVLLISLQMF